MKVKLGQGNGSGTFGPEIGIAEAFVQNSDRNLYIIKIACGASNLKNDWAARNSRMYPFMIDYIETEMLILKMKAINQLFKHSAGCKVKAMRGMAYIRYTKAI